MTSSVKDHEKEETAGGDEQEESQPAKAVWKRSFLS